jgi:glyoxylase-like metal-dependent hydrolase (beta-lactamase superfamily II)
MNDKSPSEIMSFDRSFEVGPGELVTLSRLVRRMLANNPGPMTFKGTCTYVVGHGQVAVIDPGPNDPTHVSRLLAALANETITHILVTHTHRDHSPAAQLLKEATGASIIGCASYKPARDLVINEANRADAANDLTYVPDAIMQDGDCLEGDGFSLTAIATPGHTMNHLCFALPQEQTLFSGDHVMAWSTSIVAPPDGSMRHYMDSLDKLRRREDALFWPGHGGPVKEPQRFLRALVHHRHQREAAILARLSDGHTSIETIVLKIYDGLDPALRGAAALSVLAHLEDLVARGSVKTEGTLTLESPYRLS